MRLKKYVLSVFFISLIMVSVLSTVFAVVYDCASGNHKYELEEILNPTADTDGYEWYVCELCGVRYEKILLATEHSWGFWVVDEEPACKQPGLRHRICSKGLTHTEEEIIPSLGHGYTEAVKEPGCTEAGVKTFTCQRCGDSYSEPYGDALGHIYAEKILTEASCQTDGVKEFSCTRCGDAYQEPVPSSLMHDYEKHADMEASCDTDGRIVYTCRLCGDSYDETIPTTGHDYGEWIVDKKQTLATDGHKYKVCSKNSAHIIEESIPKSISFDVTPLDAFLAAANLGFLTYFIVSLLGDLHVIRWDAKKRKGRLI